MRIKPAVLLEEMPKRSAATRKSRRGYYLTQRVWSPFGHAINATGESIGEVAGTASNIVKRGLHGAKRLGNIWTSHTNMAIKNVVSRKKRSSRRNGKATRRNRKH